MLTDHLTLIKSLYSPSQCESLYQHFVSEHSWPTNEYLVGGRVFNLPRLQTWHADSGIVYSYSNNLLHTRDWTPRLFEIRHKVEQTLATSFNAVLVNYYRNGLDSVGWHADDEIELGPQPVIASLSLGHPRHFYYRDKHTRQEHKLLLESGSLLFMHPSFQHHYQHAVLQDDQVNDGRINLTFRRVLRIPAAHELQRHIYNSVC